MGYNDRSKTKEYRERTSSALNPRAHTVSSYTREQGDAPYKEKERFYGADRYTVEQDVSRITKEVANRNIFWGDVDYDENWRDIYLLRKIIGDISNQLKLHNQKENLMSLHSLIANGGRVVVLGGRMNPSWARWQSDPRILFWTGDRSEIEKNFSKSGDIFPSNTHGVIISRFLSHATSAQVLQEAKRRRMTIMGPKNDGEVTRMLEEITTVPPPTQSTTAPAPRSEPRPMRPPVKGELVEFAKKFDDATKSIREMGKAIHEKLKEKGIDAKQLSVEQTIGNMRRAAGVFANPKLSRTLRKEEEVPPPPPPPLAVPPLPVAPPPPPVQTAPPSPVSLPPQLEGTLVLLKMIDDLQAGLNLLKDEVRRMHEQNAEYRQLEAKLAELGFIRK